MIILNPDDHFPFQFGLHKARLILHYVEEIRDFVEHAEQAPHEQQHATAA